MGRGGRPEPQDDGGLPPANESLRPPSADGGQRSQPEKSGDGPLKLPPPMGRGPPREPSGGVSAWSRVEGGVAGRVGPENVQDNDQ